MSSEKRWIINDALGFLLQLSRLCCLAPVRFVKIRTDTFIYISRPLLLFSVIITSFVHLYKIYFIYLDICNTERGNYNELIVGIFNVCSDIVFISYAVLHSGTRINNYMTCLTKLQRAIRGLQRTDEFYIKKWHVLITFITLTGGIYLVLIFYIFIYGKSIDSVTCILMLEVTLAIIVQQQFLYFALYVSFVLKLVKDQLQMELSKIICDKDGKQLGNFTMSRFNIPLGSINKAIDMIGMTDKLFPDVVTTQKQNTAQRIRQIVDCYVLVCEAMQKLNSSDDFLMFLLFIHYSCNIVFSSYGVIKLIQDESLLSVMLIIKSFEILEFAIRVIIIVEPCHVAHEMISKIRFLVCEIMCHVTSTSDPMYKVIEELFHQMVLNDTSYTVLGICKIGRSLVTSIIAVVTTVLITIFEF